MRPAIALEAPAQSALGKRSLSLGLREADYARYVRPSLPALVFLRLAAAREAEGEGEGDNGAPDQECPGGPPPMWIRGGAATAVKSQRSVQPRLPYLAQETQVKRFSPFPKSLT